MYNAPRDLADHRTLWLWRQIPDFVHPHFAPKDFGTLAREADEHLGHTLTATEWDNSQVERRKNAEGLHCIFNFEKLLSYIKGEEASVNERAKLDAYFKQFDSLLEQARTFCVQQNDNNSNSR